jgi:histidine phosphotransfer protein HptB
MEQLAYEAAVPKELADLLPDFMANRQKDVAALRAALEEANVEQLRSVGHRMKGIGASYGFDPITAFGRQIEQATKAEAGVIEAIAAVLEAYDAYLANVRVTFV